MTVAEPRWDRDLAYGQQGELQVDEYLKWIAKGNGRVETKRKRLYDLEFYVEQQCDKGRRGQYQPSGINVSEADVWAFVVADSGVAFIIPSRILRASLQHKSVRPKEEKDGSCPTKGTLVHLMAMLKTAEGLR